MIQSIKIISFLLFVVLFSSCSKIETKENFVKLDRRKTSDLLDKLDSISLKKPEFFYTKISTDYNDTTKNISFKTSVRMVKDSAINILITYAKIPIINSMITKDSLTVVNKRDKCVIKKDLSYIKENFGIDFNYKNLEEIILGLPLDYDIQHRYFQINDPFNYIVSSHRKHKIRRSERNAKEDIVIKYYLSSSSNELTGMQVFSPSDSTEIKIEYKSRELIDGFLLPKEVYIQTQTPRNNIVIQMTYEKMEVNQRQPLIVVIPEGYEKCEEK
jgi:hypothetical protein